jgi:hypothetical protein
VICVVRRRLERRKVCNCAGNICFIDGRERAQRDKRCIGSAPTHVGDAGDD